MVKNYTLTLISYYLNRVSYYLVKKSFCLPLLGSLRTAGRFCDEAIVARTSRQG